jgi:hypothetical protein
MASYGGQAPPSLREKQMASYGGQAPPSLREKQMASYGGQAPPSLREKQMASYGGQASTADEVDDLDLIALLDRRGVEQCSLQHNEIEFNGDAAGIDVETREKVGDSERTG